MNKYKNYIQFLSYIGVRNIVSNVIAKQNYSSHEISSLEDLEKYIQENNISNLQNSGNLCIYRGNPKSDIMIIGEAPGEQEDLKTMPFVGPSGELLQSLVMSANLEKEPYITNSIFWRPPNNRKPTIQEINECSFILKKQIEIVMPKVILLCGNIAVCAVCASDCIVDELKAQILKNNNINVLKNIDILSDGVTKIRGNVIFDKFNLGIPCIPTLHPSYVIRKPNDRKKVWSDILLAKKISIL